MFGKDGASKDYLRLPARRRGWGRILGLAALLMLVSARLAYGSEPVPSRSVVVAPGDTLWSIAQTRYRIAGDNSSVSMCGLSRRHSQRGQSPTRLMP